MSMNDVFRVECNMSVSGRSAGFSTHWVQTSADPDTPNAQQVLVSWNNVIMPLLRAAVALDVFIPIIKGYRFIPQGVPATLIFADNNGSNGSESIPSNKACVISLLQVDLPAKHNGRIYLPGVGENNTDGNVFTNSFVTGAAQNLRDALVNSIDDGTPANGSYAPVVYTGQADPYPPPAGNFKLISGGIVRPQIFSQRPRRARTSEIIT